MIDFTKKVIKSKLSTKPKFESKPIHSAKVKYNKSDDVFYIEVTANEITVLMECFWSLDSVHSGFLYSHPRNNMHEEWFKIKWPELTKKLDALAMIFKQWSVVAPGLKVDYVVQGDKAQIIKVYDK